VTQGQPIEFADGEIPPAVRPCELPTTLVIQDLRTGSGHLAAAGDTVFVDYTGIRAVDGAQFDSSYERDEPLDFAIGRGSVIKGWDDGLIGAQAGTVRRLDIPTDLAYGDNPPGGDIRPGDPLTFVLEVRAVVPPVTPDQAPTGSDIPPSISATDVTFTDVTVGDGALVELGSTALVHLLLVRGDNQAVLYNTWERNELVPVPIGEESPIPGLGKGLEGAQVGTLRIISMPPTFAFGEAGDVELGLPPATDLIIVAEVFGVT
jgi:FKBP-type peptidyl-prolyl cis-trans isomerase